MGCSIKHRLREVGQDFFAATDPRLGVGGNRATFVAQIPGDAAERLLLG